MNTSSAGSLVWKLQWAAGWALGDKSLRQEAVTCQTLAQQRVQPGNGHGRSPCPPDSDYDGIKDQGLLCSGSLLGSTSSGLVLLSGYCTMAKLFEGSRCLRLQWETWGWATEKTWCDCVRVGGVAEKNPQSQLRWCKGDRAWGLLDGQTGVSLKVLCSPIINFCSKLLLTCFCIPFPCNGAWV